MERFKIFLLQHYRITESDWDVINQYFKVKTLKKQEFFVQERKLCREAGFLLAGIMRYFGYDEEGNEQTCYFAMDNDFVVEPYSFPAQVPATTFNLQNVTSCEIAVISYDKHKTLCNVYPKWAEIYNSLVQKAMGALIDQKAMLAYDAAKRYEHFVAQYPLLAERVPLQYIASYLGITQPSLSRLRKQAAKTNVIR